METLPLEQRVAVLEEEMGRLKQDWATARQTTSGPWWERIAGTFAEDPLYAEALRLGREHREWLPPKNSPPEQ